MSAPDPQAAVLRHLSGARWFAGKGRTPELRSLTPLPWLSEATEFSGTPGAPAVRSVIAEVGYPGTDDRGSAAPEDIEYYQLVISYRRPADHGLAVAQIGHWTDPELGEVVAYDAARDPHACSVILTALLAGRVLRGPEEGVAFHLSNDTGLSTELEPVIFAGQQSNTSIMFGDVAMIKLFRRLELGRNLDIEVHDALGRAGLTSVAGLFGWVEGSWVSHGRLLQADLAMAVEKLSEATDGWELALSYLRDGRSFAAEAEVLGRELAAIHGALREAFPTNRVFGSATASVMADRLDRAAAIAPALEPSAAALRTGFAELSDATLDTQRVHGDFHLGQTLHTPGGWKIIDFEGEPVKTMAERLAPDSVWRDVAGMLRSFDYAAASVPEAADPAGWNAECRDAFLRGYTGGSVTDEQARLLRAYEADKAIYEVVYETRNRPDWVSIPLGAVQRIARSESSPTAEPKE